MFTSWSTSPYDVEGNPTDDEMKGITPRSVDYIFDRIGRSSLLSTSVSLFKSV